VGDSQIFDNGTNVGVGAATPFSKFTIYKAGVSLPTTADNTNNAHLTLAGTNALVRLQFGTQNVSPFGGWIQASYDNGGGADGVEPLLLNPLGGSVGIGTTSPNISSYGTALTLLASSGYGGIEVYGSGSTNGGQIDFGSGTTRYAAITGEYSSSTNGVMLFRTLRSSTVTEAMRITSGGTLLINQITTLGNSVGAIEITGLGSTNPNTQTAVSLFANHGASNSSWVGYLSFFKSRGTTEGSVTAVADGDYLGMVRWSGADGTAQIRAAEIYAVVDGTVGTNDMPTRLVFATTTDGSSSPTEKLRITNNGNVLLQNQRIVGINTSDGSDDGYLGLAGAGSDGTTRAGTIYLSGNERTADPGSVVLQAGNAVTGTGLVGAIGFRTGGNPRAMITNDGQFNINDSSNTTYRFYVNGTSYLGGKTFVNGAVYIGGTPSGSWASYTDSVIGDGNLHIGCTSLTGATYVNYAVAAPAYINAQGGNVGIGTVDTQTFVFAVDGTNVAQGDSSTTIRILDKTSATTGTGGGISFGGYFDGTSSFVNTFSYIKGGKENSTAGNYASYLSFGTRINGGSATERMRITSGGNVGINTTTPGATLEVTYGSTTLAKLGSGITFTSTNTVQAWMGSENWGWTGAAWSRTSSSAAVIWGSGNNNGSFEVWTALTSDAATTAPTNSNSRFIVTNGGNIGIGTVSPGYKLEVNGSIKGGNYGAVPNTTWNGLFLNTAALAGNTGNAGVYITAPYDSDSNNSGFFRVKRGSGNTYNGTEVATSSQFRILTSTVEDTNERMRITNSGNILINQTSALTGVSTSVEMSGVGSSTPTLQASYNVYANHGAANTTWRGYYVFHRSRGTTAGSVTAVADGDYLGTLRWNGADGTGEIIAAEINAIVDGTVGTNDMPTRLVFSTTADGASSPTDRMIIRNNGVVTVNTTSTVVNNRMWVNLGDTESFRAGTWETYSYTVNNAWLGENVYFDGNFKRRAAGYAIALYSDAGSGFQVRMAGTSSAGSTIFWTNAMAINSSYETTFNQKVTATAFFESSDVRLKSNIQDLDIDVSSISAKIYEKDGKIEVGYIAQDLIGILGNAVSEREDGMLDLSYRQVHTAKIATLEKRIAQLEEQLKNK
jgi:hypothetical protein